MTLWGKIVQIYQQTLLAPVPKSGSNFSEILNTVFDEEKESHDSYCWILKLCLKILMCECFLNNLVDLFVFK